MSTIAVIETKLKKDNTVADRLTQLLKNMAKVAKDEIEDFYSEVTFKRQRQRESKKSSKQDKKHKTEQHGKTDKTDKKAKKEKKQRSEDDKVDASDIDDAEEAEEEAEEEDGLEEEDSNDDDLFGDRFAKSAKVGVSVPKELPAAAAATPAAAAAATPVGPGVEGVGGNFKKNLSTMLENAAVLGALSQVGCVSKKEV